MYLELIDMIDSREYPEEELEDECGYCGEHCDGYFCNSNCKLAYYQDMEDE